METAKAKSSPQFFKRRYFAWIGIVGLSLTLMGSLEPLIKLGNLVHFVVENWKALTTLFWSTFSSLTFDVKLSRMDIAFLNGGVFIFAIEMASYPTKPEHRFWWRFPLRAILGAIVLVLGWGIAFATAWPLTEMTTLPEPFDWKKWTQKETAVPLLCWSFFAIQTQAIFGVDPILMARRLFDVAICVAVILGLNYVALNAELIRELLEGSLRPLGE